jgi:hypothetical protein
VGVDSVLGVTFLGHKASDLTGKKDSLHALVLERESSEKTARRASDTHPSANLSTKETRAGVLKIRLKLERWEKEN